MEAMENSMAQRADLLELDCQLTRDGVVVVSHDENLSRQSGLNRDVGSLDFEDLPLYKEKLEVYFSPGHFAQGSDRHMVRLEDVFQRFPKTPMSVEVKAENEELIQKIAGLARRFERSEITIWASEKSSIMKKCKAAVSPFPYQPRQPDIEGCGKLPGPEDSSLGGGGEQGRGGAHQEGVARPRTPGQEVTLPSAVPAVAHPSPCFPRSQCWSLSPISPCSCLPRTLRCRGPSR